MNISPKLALLFFFFLSIFSSSTTSNWNTFKTLSGTHTGQKVTGLSKLKTYLNRFGYNITNFTDQFDDELESAVKLYQKNFNLNITGVLDEKTVTQMIKPRCGVPDVINGTQPMFAHPYFLLEPEIPQPRNFTYAFDPTNKVSDKVKRVFVNAFKQWSNSLQVRLTEGEYSEGVITIGFYSGDHGDGEQFDGVLGILGYGFASRSVIHLDNAENWVIDDVDDLNKSANAMDLETVVVHEIGHVLGLGHSWMENAVMFPSMPTGVRKVELADDDVEAIANLYGENNDRYGKEKSGVCCERMVLVRMLLCMVVGLLLII